MKRVIYLVLGTLVSMVVIVPSAAAQGENVQQAQEGVQQAQQRIQQAQPYMQSPEGQQALQQAQDNLQQAQADLQRATQQFQKARESEMREATSPIERTTQEGLPRSGGAPVGSALLPVAALLLLGSGVVAYAVFRRHR